MAPQPSTTGQPRLATALTDKLTQLVSLSPEEIAVLGDLQSTIRTVACNREIISEGRKYDGLLVLIEGVSIRYRILHDGRRPGCFFESALYSITALTDCAVSAVPFARLLGFFEKYPRLAATIFWPSPARLQCTPNT
jgi:hypothetical protein